MIISFVVYEIWVRILSCKRATSVENIVHCVLNTVIPVQYNDLWLYNKFLIVHISSIYSRTTSDKNNNSKPPYPLPGPNSNQINAYTHTHTPNTGQDFTSSDYDRGGGRRGAGRRRDGPTRTYDPGESLTGRSASNMELGSTRGSVSGATDNNCGSVGAAD